MSEHLDSGFLDRVRRSYGLALKEHARARGRVWRAIDRRRRDVHDALVARDATHLREIFRNPLSTDLYFGTDNLCRTYHDDRSDDFLALALTTERAKRGQYQAGRLCNELASLREKSVVEIGPGVGHTVYYAYLSGVTDYTTVDLPLGMVAQACFLGAALGPDKIWLDGEAPGQAEGRIKLFCNHRKLQRTFGIGLNVDSMTEMSLSAALDYADWLNQHVYLFISVNHESNPFTVAEVAEIKFAATHYTRNAWPLRKGYFEESFLLANGAPSELGIAHLRIISSYRRGRTILSRRLGLPYRRIREEGA